MEVIMEAIDKIYSCREINDDLAFDAVHNDKIFEYEQ